MSADARDMTSADTNLFLYAANPDIPRHEVREICGLERIPDAIETQILKVLGIRGRKFPNALAGEG